MRLVLARPGCAWANSSCSRHAPSGATTGRSRGRAVRLPDLGTLSAAMPVQLALLSLGAGIVAVALVALIDAVARARRLHRQRALCGLAALSSQQFEEVIADAFRRHGYQVREVGDRGQADGGVDVVLVWDGRTTLVQAKHWRRDRVGVQLIRELYGVQGAMHV